jgi:hypothetical protein
MKKQTRKEKAMAERMERFMISIDIKERDKIEYHVKGGGINSRPSESQMGTQIDDLDTRDFVKGFNRWY